MKNNKLNIIFTEEEIKKLNLKKEKYYYIINKKTKIKKNYIKKLH